MTGRAAAAARAWHWPWQRTRDAKRQLAEARARRPVVDAIAGRLHWHQETNHIADRVRAGLQGR